MSAWPRSYYKDNRKPVIDRGGGGTGERENVKIPPRIYVCMHVCRGNWLRLLGPHGSRGHHLSLGDLASTRNVHPGPGEPIGMRTDESTARGRTGKGKKETY